MEMFSCGFGCRPARHAEDTVRIDVNAIDPEEQDFADQWLAAAWAEEENRRREADEARRQAREELARQLAAEAAAAEAKVRMVRQGELMREPEEISLHDELLAFGMYTIDEECSLEAREELDLLDMTSQGSHGSANEAEPATGDYAEPEKKKCKATFGIILKSYLYRKRSQHELGSVRSSAEMVRGHRGRACTRSGSYPPGIAMLHKLSGLAGA